MRTLRLTNAFKLPASFAPFSRSLAALFFLVVCLLLSGLLFAQEAEEVPAPKEPDAVPELLPPVPMPGDTFLLAEEFFHSGKFAEARLQYDDFVKNHPQDTRVQQALLRLGELDLNDKSYRSAQRIFDYLLARETGKDVGRQARFLRGVCLFHLEENHEAKAVFRQSLRDNPDGRSRLEALVYLGRLQEREKDFIGALQEMIKLRESDADKLVSDQAEKIIERVILNGLEKEQLVSLARDYRDRFPGDLALSRLIDIYRAERDLGNYQIALEDMVNRFPSHPDSPSFQKQLDQIRDNPRRVVRLAAVLPLSGKRAVVGQKVLQGIQLAFNQMPLIEKDRVELVVRDSGLGRSVNEMVKELAEDPNVVGIIGPVLSEEVKTAAPILQRFEIAGFTPTASSSGLTEVSPNVFRNALTREIQARFLARYAVNELDLKRFVILYPEETFGQELKDLFTREVEGVGGSVVESLPYSRSQNDFREQILKIGGVPDDKLKTIIEGHLKRGTQPKPLDDRGNFSRPVVEGGVFDEDDIEALKVSLEFNYDAIFIPGFYDKVGLIAPQLAFYNVEKVKLLGTNGWNSPELVKNARNYLRSAIFVDGFFADSEATRNRNFSSNFVQQFGEEPSALSAQSFDCASILLNLIREGAKTRRQILAKLPTVKDFQGVAGRTTILPTGESEKYLARLKIKGHRIIEMD